MEKKKKGVLEGIESVVEEIVQKLAMALRNLLWQRKPINLYRVTERMLRAYPKYRIWEYHPEEYGFFPVEKSKDISIAPPPGSGVRDHVEITDEFINARKASFERTMARYYDIKTIVELFQDQPEFIVIRLYYFNEDINGNDRGPDAKRLTWEEIADELEAAGIHRSVSALRIWRSRLVQEMTVMLFGVDGALSLESTSYNREEKNDRHPDKESENHDDQ